MRHSFIALSTITLTALCLCGPQTTQAQTKAEELKTDKEKASYFVGYSVGSKLASDSLDVDPKIIAKAIADALAGHEPAMEMQELQAAIQKLASQAGEKIKKEGLEYLVKNGKKKGVKTTKSGLQYEVLKEGTGAKPKATDTVNVHYHGTLITGKVFDSSVDRGEPISFPLNGVIKGWTEGVQLMKVGSKYRFVIPSELAYGERGAGADIKPNSTLIFEVELLGIETPGNAKLKLQ